MKLTEIWRYPVKSLSGQRLDRAVLNPGLGLPHDRRWALARPDGDATDKGAWLPKAHFYVLAREYGLAELRCSFDERSGQFSLDGPDGLHAEGNMAAPEGRTAIASAVVKHLDLSSQDAPTLVEAANLGYFDATQGPVSILNMNSLRDLGSVLGSDVDPLRFRMNFYLEGVDAWAEMAWPEKRIRIGQVELHVTQITGRCKATHVNPDTAETDIPMVSALKEHYGHTQFGVYAEVISGGPVQPGDEVQVLD